MAQMATSIPQARSVRFRPVRPMWLCRLVAQQTFLLCDASGSMKGAKAEDASRARRELVDELAQPGNRDGFQVAVVEFNREARIVNELTPATSLTQMMGPIATGGGTNITAALELTLPLASSVPDDGSFLRPVAVLFSDGGHNNGPAPDDVALELKTFCDLVTVAFGTGADEALLKRIASSPQHFHRCRDGAELRAFMAHVGQTIVRSTVAGQNAGPALTRTTEYDDME